MLLLRPRLVRRAARQRLALDIRDGPGGAANLDNSTRLGKLWEGWLSVLGVRLGGCR
mgnify:CR=1 FL=1